MRVICIDASYDAERVRIFGYVVPLVLGETYTVRGVKEYIGYTGYYLENIINRNTEGCDFELSYNANRFIECSEIDELELGAAEQCN